MWVELVNFAERSGKSCTTSRLSVGSADDAHVAERRLAGLLLEPTGSQMVPSWIECPPPPLVTPACAAPA